jgi:hypothetical protein
LLTAAQTGSIVWQAAAHPALSYMASTAP